MQFTIVMFLISFHLLTALYAETDTKKTAMIKSFEYKLTISAENGYVLKLPDQEFYQEGQKVRLLTRPSPGYRFSSWGGDVEGTRLITDLVMNSNKKVTATFRKWNSPIGIPNPYFGIFETYRMYDTPSKRNRTLTYCQNTEGGYYTHYVDPTNPQATNTNNNYGTISKPRVSLPDARYVPEGSIIEIGGNTTISGQLIFTVKGSLERPIFIRGGNVSNLVMLSGGDLYLRSKYLIFENIRRTDYGPVIRSTITDTAYRIVIRNCMLKKTSAVSYDSSASTDIVFYGNYVNGDAFDPDSGDFPEKDGAGGIGLEKGSDSIWIIDNIITRCGGDACGGGHAAKYTARNIYIGRNIMYTCGENAVDLKEIDKVVVSQCTMFDFKGWSSGSDGTGAVIHYGPKYSPKNVWLLYNEIFECTDKGIQVGGAQVDDVFIIGNIIHDIHNQKYAASGYETWGSNVVHMINNVFYNVDNGAVSKVQNEGSYLIFQNNIISKVSRTGSHLVIDGTSQIQNSSIKNNIFFQPTGNPLISWGNKTYTFAHFKINTKKGEGCIQDDPLFINADKNNFSLTNDVTSVSPAIDAGNDCYLHYDSLYFTVFKMHILNDFGESKRVVGGLNKSIEVIDIGAYESHN